MKKFIPLIILVAGILSAVSCRQVDELSDSSLPINAKIESNNKTVLNDSKTAKVNDSIIMNQTTNEQDPPVKDPIKF